MALFGHDLLLLETGDALLLESGDALLLEGNYIDLQAELAGAGNGWTSLWKDVRLDEPVSVRYGINGNGPLDLVAEPGQMRFLLNNAANNTGGLQGYYSPGHANARSGFDLGIAMRFVAAYNGSIYYKFVGWLDRVAPVAGTVREQTVQCTVTDWMEEAAKHKLKLLTTQVSQRADQLIATVYGNVTRQPTATSLATGIDTFSYALDNAYDEQTTALTELQRIAQSELGYVFVKGDTATGGVLAFQSRHSRLNSASSLSTLSDNMLDFVVRRERANIFNRFQVTVHPREVDAAATTVLFTLRTKPSVAPGQTVTIDGRYTDPDNRATRVGGTAMVTPVSPTDFTMNSNEDGTGTDLTANFSVTATLGANTVRFAITNNGTALGYVTLLQCRGKGLYDYEPYVYTANDSTSQTNYGLGERTVEMPYQNSANVASDAGEYLVSQWKNPVSLVEKVGFLGFEADDLVTVGLAREVGERVTLAETVTGVNTAFFIQSVEMTYEAPDVLRFVWGVAPANLATYWTLGVSQLGVDTRLAY